MNSRLYVLVRTDLSPSYSAVQAGHAVAKHCITFPEKWKNGTLIYLRIPTKKEFVKWKYKLHNRGKEFVTFYEPDINEETALALESDGRLFRSLQLL